MDQPQTGAGTGTAPGIRHADMHPLTKKRVDAQTMVGRAVADYGQAWRLYATEEVTHIYVDRKKDELNQALARLVEAAQNEGKGEAS